MKSEKNDLELFIVKWPQVVKNTYCSFSFVDEVAFQRNLFSSVKKM